MRCVLLVAALLGALPAVGLAAPPDEPYPLTLQVGEEIALSKTGTIEGQAGAPICDDLKVATAVAGADGLAIKGVGPGKTLCSVASGSGMGLRRVYRITVIAKDPSAPKPAKR